MGGPEEKVIAVKPVPSMIEGEPSEKQERLFRDGGMYLAESMGQVGQLLEKVLPRRVGILDRNQCEASRLMCMLRDMEDAQSLFIITMILTIPMMLTLP